MYLAELHVSGFRKLLNATMHFQPGLNVIVGPNNVGKTAIVDALRALLAGPDEPFLRLSDDDIHTPKGGARGGAITFKYIFRDLSLDDEADFLHGLRPTADGKMEAIVCVTYGEPDQTGRLRVRRWCGDHDDVPLSPDMLENLRGVYLPPLRDAAQGLRPSRTSQLARLIQLLSDQPGRDAIEAALAKLDDELKKHEPMVTTQESIVDRHAQMLGPQLIQTLVGDPNQGIYEFAGADGSFLKGYGKRAGIASLPLTTNYRSALPIVTVANALSSRGDTANRTSYEKAHGAFYAGYKKGEERELLDLFRTRLTAAGIDEGDAVILFRGNKGAGNWRGDGADIGEGVTALFAAAAIHRDRHHDFQAAYRSVVAGIVRLSADADLGFKLGRATQYPDLRGVRRHLWSFTRDASIGLPSATLVATTEWQPTLLQRVRELLAELRSQFGIQATDKVGRRISKKGLKDAPLIDVGDLSSQTRPPIRIDTVHQAKGESIRGVMYVATRDHVRELLAGTSTEVGRIGYVAVTRAKDLFILGMPAASAKEFAAHLRTRGIEPLEP